MAGELIKVQFHGDVLDATQDDNGTVWVSLRRCCENLTVDLDTQAKKLRAKPWAVVREMPTTGADGKTYSMLAVDLDTLPGWLFSIDARKVKEQLREKLARYQREAAKVLANHFLRKPKEPGIGAEQLRDLVTTIVAESLTPFLAQIRAATAAPPPMPIYPRATIRERLLWKNWPEASGADRKKVHKLACALIDANLLETPVQAGGPGGGGPLYFFGAQLAFLDEAIDRVREAKQRRERAAGPHLFSGAV